MTNAKKLPSGNWRVQIYVGKDESGKKVTKSFTADTKWKAEKAAEDYLKNRNENEEAFTVGEAVSGYINLKMNVLSPSTIRGYDIIRRTRLQLIMDVDIHKLTSFLMQKAINEDAARLSNKSIKEAVHLVTSAMKLYGVNTAFNITLPQKKPQIKELPTAPEILQAVRGTEVELPCLLAMWLSLRMSEVRGLQFRDIHGSTLTVCRSRIYFDGEEHLRDVNKTYESTRVLNLPPYIMELIQKVPHEKDTDFVVSMGYQHIKGIFNRSLEKYGLKMRFHDLRHISASVMLALGIPDKYAMERGGWSTPNTLKNVYQHTFSKERQLADQKVDDYFNKLLFEAEEKPRPPIEMVKSREEFREES